MRQCKSGTLAGSGAVIGVVHLDLRLNYLLAGGYLLVPVGSGRGDFERLASLDAVLQRLFGELLPPFGTSAVGAHDDR